MDPINAHRVEADSSHLFGLLLADPAALVRAVRDQPDDGRAWAALIGWLRDNGHADEAEAVGAFWPAIADGLYTGMPLSRAMSMLGRHAAGLARLARRLSG